MKNPFPITDHLIHLNHAAVGPWPRVTADALTDFAEENASVGSLNYPRWMRTEQALREQLAQLVNARSHDEIALVKNTSEGLSFVAYGLDWRAGDNVVGIAQEFPSNRFVWDSLASRGVEFRKLDIASVEDPEQALIDLCDRYTRVVSISAVQYASGLRMDLERIGQFCRDNDILFCVDAIQQLGALPFDAQAVHADFVIADGHKWMLSPEGLGVFYVREQIMDRLTVLQYGWHMAQKLDDYSQQDFELADNAQRFECGSPNMAGIHAMHASLGLLLDKGMHAVGEQVVDNSRWLLEHLSSINAVEVLTDTTAKRLSGIVTFRSTKVDAERIYRGLNERGVLCAPRGGGVRLSPHFYTPRAQLEQTIEWIRELAG